MVKPARRMPINISGLLPASCQLKLRSATPGEYSMKMFSTVCCSWGVGWVWVGGCVVFR